MPLTSAKFVPYEMRSSLVKMMSYNSKNPSGTLYNSYFEEEQFFESLTELVLLMDELQDNLCFPQKTMESRSFQKKGGKVGTKSKKVSQKWGDLPVLASFKINVMFRQNASWQGSILWVEQSLESEFRSVLELTMLLDSVLTSIN